MPRWIISVVGCAALRLAVAEVEPPGERGRFVTTEGTEESRVRWLGGLIEPRIIRIMQKGKLFFYLFAYLAYFAVK